MSVCVLQAYCMHSNVSLSCQVDVLKYGSVCASMCAQVCVGRMYTQLCMRLCTAAHGVCYLGMYVSRCVSGSVTSCCGDSICSAWEVMCPTLCRVSPQVCVTYTQRYMGADMHRCVYVSALRCM